MYDELNRVFQTDRVLLLNTIGTVRPPDVADGASDIGGGDLTPGDDQVIPGVGGVTFLGRVSTRTEYDRSSRTTFSVEDDEDTHRRFYDGADRVIHTLDPEGNTVETAYDDGDNVIETRETDVTQVLGVPDEVFLTTYFYDSLDRLQRTVDNIGQTRDYRYDSRNNLVVMADAQGPVTGASIARRAFEGGVLTVDDINDFGNVTLYFYDGLNRKTREDRVLTASGDGDGVHIGADIFGVKTTMPTPDPAQSDDGLITVRYEWDRNTLQSTLTDDNGNQTQYTYDNLNRRLTEIKGMAVAPNLADRDDPDTTIAYTYDPDDNAVRLTDENGSTSDCQFDAINRHLSCETIRGPGVVGTTAASYQYDGLSRLTRTTDNNDPGEISDDSVITYAYDSLSRVIEETQKIGALTARAISSSWRAENLRSDLIYPQSGTFSRQVEYTYDALDRLNTVADQGATQDIADYDYIGTFRVAERSYPINGTHMTYLDNTDTTDLGYDGLRRPVQLRHLESDNSLVVGFTHIYDRMSNKLDELKLHDMANREDYDYDAAYRLIDFDRPDAGAIEPLFSDWTLDGVGNWQQVVSTESGPPVTETRRHSSFNEIVERSDGGVTTIVSDDNGNETDDGTFTFQWDYRNRLRTVTRKADSALIAVYSYDAANRRIRKIVTNSGPLDALTDFYYDGWQVVEERDAADTLTQQYVYGVYIDEPLVLDRNLEGYDSAIGPGDQRLFYHHNTLYSVFALTTTSGNLLEGYQYDAYGRQTVFEPGLNGVVDFGGDIFTPGGTSAVGNPYLLTGRRVDDETDLYFYRARYHDAVLGRFLQRDPEGYIDGPGLYEYAGNRPTLNVDPYGLFSVAIHRTITGIAVTAVLPTLAPLATPKCQTFIRSTLQKANDKVDLGTMFLAYPRHFNRKTKVPRGVADTSYRGILTTETTTFYTALLTAAPLKPLARGPQCTGALQAQGRIDHSWQDFYVCRPALIWATRL